uniref:C-type lectin domain-containing protein n=1 Tax=Acrobeloides nanus TaxID=290746 RepID=A0A914DT40_9BILA
MQKFLAIFAFFNFASIICCACPAGSFNGVRPQDCFTYRNVPRYNLDAETDCESLGGFLASIHDSTTNKIIGAQLKKMDTFANSVWLGGYYRSEWTWNDQTPFDFQAFAPGQNGTDYSDQLLSVFNTSDNTWYTTDLYSEIQFPYLCTVPNISFTTPKPTHSPCPSGSFPGIGLTDCFMFQNASLNCGCNYIWSWLDRPSFNYENFANRQTAENPPFGKKAAVRIDNGFWNPTNADEKHPFLCQVPPV